jgi:hypothetical protein
MKIYKNMFRFSKEKLWRLDTLLKFPLIIFSKGEELLAFLIIQSSKRRRTKESSNINNNVYINIKEDNKKNKFGSVKVIN